VGKLSNIWRQPKLSLSTKLRLYNVHVVSVLLYGCETWVLLQTDERRLEAFHMSCQRRILDIRWYLFVTNTTVLDRTKEESIIFRTRRQRMAVFGHIRLLPEQAPAHAALRLAVDIRSGQQA